nr:zinc finger, CCHC-type [Tanacetum cinerariifolium]
MGDVNPICTLGDYSKPSHVGYRNTIELPLGNSVVPLRSNTIRLVQNEYSFHGLRSEDPNQHLKDFLKLVDSLDLDGSITTWEDLTTRFLAQYLFTGKDCKTLQRYLDVLTTSWRISLRSIDLFQGLTLKVPHYGIYRWLQIQNFYDHQQSNSRDSKAKEEERKREGDLEDTNTIAYNGKQKDTPQLERKDTTAIDNLGPNRDDEGIDWLDVKEPIDLVDISEESVYELLIKDMPKCSLNYDFRIKKGDPRNLKILCMIRHKFTATTYINVDLPMNIMSPTYYNSIRKNGYEYRGRNFVRLGRDMHVFVVNMSHVMDFIILENIETNIDPSLSSVVFGRPFVEIACLAINRKYGLMTFTDRIKEITFKTAYKDPEKSELSREGHIIYGRVGSVLRLYELSMESGFLSPKEKRGWRGVKEKEFYSGRFCGHVEPMQSDVNVEVENDAGTTVGQTPVGNTPGMSSYANVTSAPAGNEVDVVVPVESIRAISKRVANTTYGFFLGKRVAYPVVANYVRNTCGKYGLVKSMRNSYTGIFSFQFSSMDGLDAMLENGPWFIRNNPLILKKSRYARYLIEVRADVELKDNTMVAMPKLVEEGFCTSNVRVEYEWKPPRCARCKVFGLV